MTQVCQTFHSSRLERRYVASYKDKKESRWIGQIRSAHMSQIWIWRTIEHREGMKYTCMHFQIAPHLSDYKYGTDIAPYQDQRL